MRLLVINDSAQKDITSLISSVTWSGDISSVSRKLDFSVAVSPTDAYLPKVVLKAGSVIKFYGDKNSTVPLFSGFIFAKNKSESGSEMTVNCYDAGIYLLKNKGVYNFKKLTAEAITTKVCSDFGVPVGTLAKTGITQSIVFAGDAIYDIINKAYTQAGKQNGKKYLITMLNNKLSVVQVGTIVVDCILDNERNITDSSYSETIENVINKVVITDENGKKLDTVSNEDSIKAYGIFQEVYQKESGVDAKTAAKNLLVNIERTGSIDGIGVEDCTTGYGVGIKDSYTGMVGGFIIQTDTHTWQDGIHTMNLTVNFDQLMSASAYQALNKKIAASVSSQVYYLDKEGTLCTKTRTAQS